MNYVICVRRVRNGEFDPEPAPLGATRFLDVPDNARDISPSHEVTAKRAWTENVLKEAHADHDHHDDDDDHDDCGGILVFVHGFNTPTATMLERHKKIKKKLAKAGFKGVVVSFDWPSDSSVLNYLEDRRDAKASALRLVDQGLKRFVKYQQEGCTVNVHVLAHSMGAYVVREAFDDADDNSTIASVSWSASQVMLVSGDVSAGSLSAGNSKSSSLYRHTVRVTNYANPYDRALKLSNIKRVGVAPRAGRIGLPDDAPGKAVNVDCGAYFDKNRHKFRNLANAGHTWYFDDQKFFDDVMHTLQGDIDRHSIPTRKNKGGKLSLKV